MPSSNMHTDQKEGSGNFLPSVMLCFAALLQAPVRRQIHCHLWFREGPGKLSISWQQLTESLEDERRLTAHVLPSGNIPESARICTATCMRGEVTEILTWCFLLCTRV